MSLLGTRWTGLILRSLLSGETRVSPICSYVPGLSDRLLSERLKELEAEGIVERHVYAETPVRVEYTLTQRGDQLRPIVEAAQAWANPWASVGRGVDPLLMTGRRGHAPGARRDPSSALGRDRGGNQDHN